MRHVIATLWVGDDLPDYSANKYGIRDVVRLWRGMRQHVTDGVLHVLCDDVMLNQLRFSSEMMPFLMEDTKSCLLHRMRKVGIGGWSNVLEAFHPAFWKDIGSPDRVLLVGLDTVFVRNSDWLFDWNQAAVGIPCDPFVPEENPPCDAVVTYGEEGRKLVWDEYERTRPLDPFPHLYNDQPSEMALLRHLHTQHQWPLLEGLRREKLISYKGCHVSQDGVPETATIVYFHGTPKPSELPIDDPMQEFM